MLIYNTIVFIGIFYIVIVAMNIWQHFVAATTLLCLVTAVVALVDIVTAAAIVVYAAITAVSHCVSIVTIYVRQSVSLRLETAVACTAIIVASASANLMDIVAINLIANSIIISACHASDTAFHAVYGSLIVLSTRVTRVISLVAVVDSIFITFFAYFVFDGAALVWAVMAETDSVVAFIVGFSLCPPFLFVLFTVLFGIVSVYVVGFVTRVYVKSVAFQVCGVIS